ncbi:Rrf2 family transcriptional regulator [Candidatus Bipolaricaulota bacterium]|nr:Rrf2 family transcriptional regulator [Candidatus Bipolaricaulota bacterium]
MKAAELGRRINAEVPFLKQILNRLTRAGLVRARPRRSGGYQPASSPQIPSLRSVAQAIGGHDVRQQCLFNSSSCDGSRGCRLSHTWQPMRKPSLPSSRPRRLPPSRREAARGYIGSISRSWDKPLTSGAKVARVERCAGLQDACDWDETCEV